MGTKPHELVAKYLRGQLAMSGHNQAEAAAVIGVVQQAFSRRITGKTPFSIDELTALVKYLGIDYAEMIDEVSRLAARESKRSNDVPEKSTRGLRPLATDEEEVLSEDDPPPTQEPGRPLGSHPQRRGRSL